MKLGIHWEIIPTENEQVFHFSVSIHCIYYRWEHFDELSQKDDHYCIQEEMKGYDSCPCGLKFWSIKHVFKVMRRKVDQHWHNRKYKPYLLMWIERVKQDVESWDCYKPWDSLLLPLVLIVSVAPIHTERSQQSHEGWDSHYNEKEGSFMPKLVMLKSGKLDERDYQFPIETIVIQNTQKKHRYSRRKEIGNQSWLVYENPYQREKPKYCCCVSNKERDWDYRCKTPNVTHQFFVFCRIEDPLEVVSTAYK